MVEMMVALAIFVTLAAITIPVYTGYLQKARVARCVVEMRMIERAVDLYEYENAVLPNSLDEVGMATMVDPWGLPYEYLNLVDLLASSSGEVPYWHGGGGGGGSPWDFLLPDAAYAGPGGGPPPKPRKDRFLVPINSDYDLYSKGKDGESTPPLTAVKSRDDIVRANDGAFIGLAVDF